MITIKEYRKAESLEEAWELNQKKRNRIIAGMLWTKMSRAMVGTAIDLSALGLDTIEEDEQEFRIGCMVPLRKLECHEGLQTYSNGAVKQALCHIVGVQFRNLATAGGSIYGRYGFSDVLTMFLVMDTYVELYKGGIVPLTEFVKMPKDRDILVRLIVKKTPAVYSYQSVRNTATDFPVLSCAAVRKDDGTCLTAIGARPGRAVLFTDENGILKQEITQQTAETLAESIQKTIATGSNIRGSAQYRKHLTGVLVKRAYMDIAEKR